MQAVQGLHAVVEGLPRRAVFDHETKRLVSRIPVVVVQEVKRLAVGNANVFDRRRLIGHQRPQADAVQSPLGSQGNG